VTPKFSKIDFFNWLLAARRMNLPGPQFHLKKRYVAKNVDLIMPAL
jgi:hypothetical protein